jgi:hypothetical protein
VQPDLWEEESPAAGTCFDFNDNNCDGLADHEQAVCQTGEFCNAFDDDNDGEIDEDFTDLDDSCTVGIGLCERSGAKICSNDDLGTMCSVSPGAPLAEGPPGSLSCSDGLDNDCDGTVDLADASCQLEAEICDGLDNTGEGDVDEAFPDLGSSCMVGVGACQASGAFVCSANGADTMCSATPGLSSVEGPTGPTCNDGIDNDCDGLTDAADDNCAADQLVVNCALPYLHSPNPPNGDSCEAWHTIQYSTNASPDALVTAELVALDADGNVLASLPVQNGDEANLKSRIKNLQAMTKGNRHWLTGPVPLLRVMVDDNGIQRSAYCSNIPYLEVMKPAGEVVSESEGDYTEIEVALPLVDPTTLSLKIDGIDDIISQLGLNPATDFPGGPYSGNVNIHGEVVQITQLSVLSAPAADPLPTGVPAANTLRMVLSGLGCGEHIVVVDGERRVGIFPNFPPAPVCLVDDLTDKGTSVGFAVAVDSPFPGEVTFTIPTPVTGEVCHGREIVDVNVNGKVLDTASQIFTPGDGEDSGDLFTYIIDTTLPQTDLAVAIATGQSSGTFDPGSNRLVVGATDDLGTRAFENLIFTIGDTIAPGQPLSSSLPGGKIGEPIFLPLIVKRLTPMPGEEIAARQTIHLASWAMPADLQDPSLKLMADEVVYKAVQTKAQGIAEEAARESLAGAIPLLAEDEVSDALVAGLEQPALQTFFNQFCADATDDIEMKMREGMINKEFPGEKADLPLACDPTVHTDITDVSFNGDVACEVGLADGGHDPGASRTIATSTPTRRKRLQGIPSRDWD